MIRKLDKLRWQILARISFVLRRRTWPSGLNVLGPLGLGGRGVMKIGQDVQIVSLSRYNRAGINHPTQLAVERGAHLYIGNRVGISGAAIYCATNIRIGNDVLIGVNCRIYDTDFHPLLATDRRQRNPPISAPVNIEDDVWLGANVTVLKGVTIGARTVVAAGSVVTADLPSDCLAAGSPARVVRRLGMNGTAVEGVR